MITIEQINGEIAVLEDEKPTHVVMGKLANLYTVRDHMGIGEPDVVTPVVSERVEYSGTSEFAKVIRGKDINRVLPVVDELMSTLEVLNPRLYQSALRNLEEV